MKHLKKFKIVDDYFTFKDSADYLLPNVSYAKKEKKLFFQGVPPPTIIRAEYNATADNLLAITTTSNIRRLKVDGVNIPVPPFVTTTSEIETLAKDITLVGDGTGSIPADVFYNGIPTSWAVRPSDSTLKITDIGYIGLLISMSGITDVLELMPIDSFIESEDMVTYDESTNTFIFSNEFLATFEAIIGMGAKMSFMLINMDEDTGAIIPVDTINIYVGKTGGLPSPCVFDTEGYHNIEAEIIDKTIISPFMFMATQITSIELPDTIVEIGQGAFSGCTVLESIVIPNSVTSIGGNAFDGCNSLSYVEIGSGVNSIGNQAFRYCGLQKIVCKAEVAPEIQYNTFYSIKNNNNVLMYPKGSDYSSWMSTSNYYLGYYEWFAQEIETELPEFELDGYDIAMLVQPLTNLSATKICYTTSNISEIKVNDTVLGSVSTGYTFGTPCEWNIVRIKYYGGVTTSIPSSGFSGCTRMREVKIADSVISIGKSAFDKCSGLTGELVIPDSVTSIGDYAFRNCTGLTGELSIPDSVTNIGREAFYNCPSLISLEIGSGVTSMNGQWTFNYCTGLESIVVSPANTIYDSRENCNCIIETATNTLIVGCKNSFIPDSVTSIGDYAFLGSLNLAGNLVIPDSVTSISQYAFQHCADLTSVVIPNSVTSIGEGAFYNCSGLTSVEIGSGCASIGEDAFKYCYGLTNIAISSGNTVYDSRENCNCIIETATNTLILGCNNSFIPDSIISIGSRAFYQCSGLIGELVIPDSVISIGNNAFEYCTGLTGELAIPDSVTSIGQSAFYNCSSLTSLKIGSGLTSISKSTFSWCSGLTNIIIPDSVTSIGEDAFYYCSSLTSVVIPDSVTSIGNAAFANCKKLTNVEIGSGCTSISGTFQNCSELVKITCYAEIAPSIVSFTFRNIKYNGTLYVPSGSDYSSWMSTSGDYLGYYNWTTQTIAS